MTKPERDITRLPKWAQAEIKRLERDVAHLRGRLSQGPEGSTVFADPYSETPRPLGHETAVAFQFGESWGERYVVRMEGERLLVSGGSSIVVHPRASNCFEVEVIR